MRTFSILIVAILAIFVSCKEQSNAKPTSTTQEVKNDVNTLLNDWHKAAAEANYSNYFRKMDSISVFVGTDANEVWSKQQFESFSKPYFDKGKAWAFTPVERNVYTNSANNLVWFDELLDTWMGICRGSGVVEKVGDDWKIKHYVLSVAVPNEDINPIITIKKERDSLFLAKFKK